MTTYACLLTFTDQGVRDLAQSAERAQAFRRSAEAAGITVLAQLWTAGEYDGLLILQGESDSKVLGALSKLSALGNVRTHSLRAFDAAEFAGIAR